MCRVRAEPERRQLREHPALVGNAGAEHVVEGGDAIGRDHDQVVADGVDVANLAAANQGQAVEVSYLRGRVKARGARGKRYRTWYAKPAAQARRASRRRSMHRPSEASQAKRACLTKRYFRVVWKRFAQRHSDDCRRRPGRRPAGVFLRNADLARVWAAMRAARPDLLALALGADLRDRLRGPRRALAVPARAARPDALLGGVSRHGHRLCGIGGAAGARRRGVSARICWRGGRA